MSEVRIRLAQKDDAGRVIAVLHETFPHFSPEVWGRVFEYPWMEPSDYGVLAEDESGRVVGFMGAIYSDRVIRGERRRVCCMTSWCVAPDQRGGGTGSRVADAYLEHMAAREIPVVILSAGRHVLDFFRQRGVEQFRRFRAVRWPGPVWGRSSMPRWVDPTEVSEGDVGREGYAIMRDHMGMHCAVGVLEAGGRYCVLISRKRTVETRRPSWMRALALDPSSDRGVVGRIGGQLLDVAAGAIVTAEVIYASDPLFLLEYGNGVAVQMARRHRVLGLSGAPHLLGLPEDDDGFDPKGYLVTSVPGLDSSDIDIAYSELVLLPF